MTRLRRIGRSELFISPLILGANVFGWTADRHTSFAVMDAFIAGGGRMIDTADAYSSFVPGHSGGESEIIIGEWLRQRGRRDDVMITTKVGHLPGEGGEGLAPARIATAIEDSLRRLQTDYVDLYLAHEDDKTQDQGEVAEAFDRLVKAGKVRVLGASNFSRDRLASAIALQSQDGLSQYHSLQNHYNLVERGDYEAAGQQFCLENEIGMTPYFGLASGYLTGKYRKAEDFDGSLRGQGIRKYFESNGPRVLSALDAIATQTGATVAQISLAWLASRPGIVAPIASATSVEQLEELLGVITLTLSGDQLALLDQASAIAEGI
ncbi:aldo/keto reductase [Agrobacterium tumefaciens]|jgi:aryl-alcohol dehydrogenase-like predicted oxidoreductase|uniref:Aldo/keto reductase n=1 Tax=Agrobacterium tumefaciens TaxID=358 RepID=A0AA44J9E9_AGRTU|nr:aldo/keto reductase [Agrobacterium tumefaciens]NSL21203.1 aldo/keto reductase [Agrobacterium tumefaciens]NTB83775.1 aldo/keto reductase [Agrobacterium tumefaciens]NTC20756.1 aldo/keto reductase [Agrobacterium tumefaciens]NTC29246.1 aldo/keto reductase [Agrobacterium tumefaciens]NTC57526.1 aldo/keto reductase [Agrobacterium tumefaciens]